MHVAAGVGRNMLSSVGAYGGLSANQLLTLFGANTEASATPTGAAPNTAPQLASIGSTIATAADPTGTIKQILAHAQMQGSSVATLGGPDQGTLGATLGNAVGGSPNTIQLGNASTSTDSSAARTFLAISSDSGILAGQTYYDERSVSSISTNAGNIDNFTLSLSLGGQSLSVDLAAAGIGELKATDSPITFSAGDGKYSVQLSEGLSSSQSAGNMQTIVIGLSMSQAQQLTKAFQAVTALSGGSASYSQFSGSKGEIDNEYKYSASLAPGYTAEFSTSMWGGGSET